ncbi:hypothetical protein LEMLEM_LOCUS27659, partial [Lemmus lemmus]
MPVSPSEGERPRLPVSPSDGDRPCLGHVQKGSIHAWVTFRRGASTPASRSEGIIHSCIMSLQPVLSSSNSIVSSFRM